MGKTSANSAEDGLAWAKKMRKVTITGGPLKGAQYGDLQESEIAKAAKAYRGDPRFLQYCRLFMASKILDVSEEPTECTDERTVVSKARRFAEKAYPWLQQCFTKNYRHRFLIAVGLLALLLSRPAFSILLGKVSILMIKSVIKNSVALVTMILDAVLEEAVTQVDMAFLPPPAQRVGVPGHDLIERGSNIYQLFMHLSCLILGTLLGRQYGTVPRFDRNP